MLDFVGQNSLKCRVLNALEFFTNGIQVGKIFANKSNNKRVVPSS
jgi:hypothetical protein